MLMRSYAPAVAYQNELEKQTAAVTGEVERAQAAAKLASEAQEQLARTIEATRYRVEGGVALTPEALGTLSSFLKAEGSGVTAPRPGGLEAQSAATLAEVRNLLAAGEGDRARTFEKAAAKLTGSPEAIASGIQDLATWAKGFVGPAEVRKVLGSKGIAAQFSPEQVLGPTKILLPGGKGGASAKLRTEAEQVAKTIEQSGPSGMAGGLEALSWYEQNVKSAGNEQLLNKYVAALSDPNRAFDPARLSPEDAAAAGWSPEDAQRAQALYREASARGAYPKIQATVYSAAAQTALRLAQEAEASAKAAKTPYAKPEEEARKRALEARGIRSREDALRTLFADTPLASSLDSALSRADVEPSTDLERALHTAWMQGVKIEDVDQLVRSSRLGGARSPAWEGASEPATKLWNKASGIRAALRDQGAARDLAESGRAYNLALSLREAELRADPSMSPEQWATKRKEKTAAVQKAKQDLKDTEAKLTAERERAEGEASTARAREVEAKGRAQFQDYQFLRQSGASPEEARATVKAGTNAPPAPVGAIPAGGVNTPAPAPAPVASPVKKIRKVYNPKTGRVDTIEE